jgi:hypothetical protein
MRLDCLKYFHKLNNHPNFIIYPLHRKQLYIIIKLHRNCHGHNHIIHVIEFSFTYTTSVYHCHGHDHMVVGFTTTYAISTYHH